MDDKLVIENTGVARRNGPVTSSDGEQHFEIAVGKNVSVSKTDGRLKSEGLAKSPTELGKN